MADRTAFHNKLCDILGTPNVYFQPPPTIQITYPCIVYQREPDDVKHADNIVYKSIRRYSVTYIDRNPDTTVPDTLMRLPMSAMNRIFTTSNLNHYTFTIYF